MRLCGISSRFQLLSPSTRQVTHALLTRPPLTYISLGFNVSPFDLHVLGTPPAFILSQDQTLMLKSFNPARISGFSKSETSSDLLFLRFALLKAVRSSFDDLKFKIFQGYSLFSYQCSLLFSATALIAYHNRFFLSTTFFKYF